MKIINKIFLILLITSASQSQPTFTRITNNPVATDQYESTGSCWIDFNNDGLLDLFVSNGNTSSQNNSLYINNGAGSFLKIITGPIVNDGGPSIGGTSGDYNNDGKTDLFVTNRINAGNFLYTNNGDSTFTKVTSGNIVTDLGNSNSSSWVDINRDGYLDLYVVNFSQNDFLYLNNGSPNYTFTKIDTAVFLMDAAGFSIVGAWGDYNNDRLPDYFVCNSGTQSDFLYKNNGNLTFSKTVINDGRASLGASWGDYDNDGDLDLFAANFLNNKNLLYNNTGAPSYNLLIADSSGIIFNDPANSVGSCWGDFDNDGDLDLFVGNDAQNNFLYLNNGPPLYTFTKVNTGSIVGDGGNTFGVSCADYDNDGQLDIFAANRLNQPNFLYKNNGNSNKWLTIKCTGVISNKSAIGTKVRVKAVINGIPTWQMQEVSAQTGYNSQNLWLHFGFGNASTIDSIKVEWINGANTTFTNVALNRNITISENGVISEVNGKENSFPENFTLYQNYPNPFNPATKIKFSIQSYVKSEKSNVRLVIYDVLGKEIATLVDEQLHPGTYEIEWNASNFPSGVYFYQLSAGDFTQTKKLMLVK